VQEFAVFLS